MTTSPFVSVIIPTHNRCAILPRTLNALCAQTYPHIEVILVADGCTDNTVAFAKTQTTPWALTVLEQPGLGPSRARNYGAESAKGSLLIFLDDDMEVVPEFVSAHVQAHQTHPNTLAIGVLKSPNLPHNYFERSLYDWWEGKFFQLRQPGYRFQYDDIFGGNISVGTEFFKQVGGFDPNLRCHEDYELGVRLMDAGAIGKLAGDAVAVHHDITDLRRSMQRRIAESKADVYLIHKHAGLHRRMPLAKTESTLSDRVIRWLAFKQPRLGALFARLGLGVLAIFEVFWLFYFWQIIFYLLQEYWYWCGIHDEIGLDELNQIVDGWTLPTPQVIFDVSKGFEHAEQQLDHTPATSVRFFMGRQWVGDIHHAPGAEKVRGGHVRRFVDTKLEGALGVALAWERLGAKGTGLGEDDVWRLGWTYPFAVENLQGRLAHPKKVVEVDLAMGVSDVDVRGFRGLHVLVRSGARMIGCVTFGGLTEPVVTEAMLRAVIAKELDTELMRAAWSMPLPRRGELAPISVVVCTRNRTSQLKECLQALLKLEYPQFEIVVVDNAPADEGTAQLTARFPVRYVREDRPGLDWARNRGVEESRYGLVAFTDDDARPDRGWLRAIASAFEDEQVMAVTGSVLPADLQTEAQNLFEFGYGGMNHGFARRVVSRSGLDATRLLWASSFGVGANMAFRKGALAEVGGFDVALDVGTPSNGGGDVEMFHRMVAKGHMLVYEPNALVWHSHRPGMLDLEKLVQNNGRSFGCYLITCAKNGTVGSGRVLQFALRFWVWEWLVKRLFIRSNGFPKRLVWQELLAVFGAPWAYVRSQRRAREFA